MDGQTEKGDANQILNIEISGKVYNKYTNTTNPTEKGKWDRPGKCLIEKQRRRTTGTESHVIKTETTPENHRIPVS